jgi:hypothetical protein
LPAEIPLLFVAPIAKTNRHQYNNKLRFDAKPDENGPLNFSFVSISIADKFFLLTIEEHAYEDVVERGYGVCFDKATAFRRFEP